MFNDIPRKRSFIGILIVLPLLAGAAFAALPVPIGILPPASIPKYVIPLVIPPEMPRSTRQPGAPAADYNIAVRQFKQQILPGGIWNDLNGRSDSFPPTTVWSYGRAEDGPPDSSGFPNGAPGVAPAPNSSFNSPALTVENSSGKTTTVRWINDLIDGSGRYLPHLFAVDQTLRWANPPAIACTDGTNRSDCPTANSLPYTGPVPLVASVHGAHVNPESKGFPEAWWLPAATNIPAEYLRYGENYGQFRTTNRVAGSAFYGYENNQPATTLWYHDHTLGMTRQNVYAGLAGFWMVRGGSYGDGSVQDEKGLPAVLPGRRPATVKIGDPNFNPEVRAGIREIPIIIQDRTFKVNGELFYPDNRTFYPGPNMLAKIRQLTGQDEALLPFFGDSIADNDIAPSWNTAAFFHTMVVNGTTWPKLNVAPAIYRFRLLNGCNSRLLNLSLLALKADDTELGEVPWYLLGADQGFSPQVTRMVTGQALQLTPGMTEPPLPTTFPNPGEKAALAMGPADRADVLVDFSRLPAGAVKVRMLNTGPDYPFGGFPIDPADLADAETTGQVMEFAVDQPALPFDALTTPPNQLRLPSNGPPANSTAEAQQLAFNEEISQIMCVEMSMVDGRITVFPGSAPLNVCAVGDETFRPNPALPGSTDIAGGASAALHCLQSVTDSPILGDKEVWEIYHMTMPPQPNHLHLVRFQLINHRPLLLDQTTIDPQPWEAGFQEPPTAEPDELARIMARYNAGDLYLWHCPLAINEEKVTMRPYVEKVDPNDPDIDQDGDVDRADLMHMLVEILSSDQKNLGYDLNGDGKVNLRDARLLRIKFHR